MIETQIEIEAPPAAVRSVVSTSNGSRPGVHRQRLCRHLNKKQFLDFERWPEWSHGIYRSVAPAAPGKSPQELSRGERVNCQIGLSFSADVDVRARASYAREEAPRLMSRQENSPALFQWTSIQPYNILNGTHSFRFDEDPSRPGMTIFKHYEVNSGYLAFLASPWVLGGTIASKFSEFNRDLKDRVEALQKR